MLPGGFPKGHVRERLLHWDQGVEHEVADSGEREEGMFSYRENVTDFLIDGLDLQNGERVVLDPCRPMATEAGGGGVPPHRF